MKKKGRYSSKCHNLLNAIISHILFRAKFSQNRGTGREENKENTFSTNLCVNEKSLSKDTQYTICI